MTSTCDLYDEHGDALAVLALPWRSFGGRTRFGGPAQTVRCYADNSLVKTELASPGEGRVLVVDGGSSLDHALLGDQVAASALENGWAGVVVAGACRDAGMLATMDLGVVALGTVPRKTRKDGSGVVGLPVVIGGGRVAPGDLVVVDEDGVVALPAASAPSPQA